MQNKPFPFMKTNYSSGKLKISRNKCDANVFTFLLKIFQTKFASFYRLEVD